MINTAQQTTGKTRQRSSRRGWYAVVTLWLLLSVDAVDACRFNVRDVGFVELGRSSYQLFWYVDPSTSPETVSSIKAVSYASLLDVNIKSEIVHLKDLSGHAGESAFRMHGASRTIPWGALVSPDGRSLPLDLEEVKGTNLEDRLWTLSELLYLSPEREKLQEIIIQSYGVVLVVEGKDTEQNQRARQAARNVVKTVTESMESLPKTIKSPPSLMVIDRATAAREKYFLWSLGIEKLPPEEAHAAVLYGRGRLIGSVINGPDLTETRLLNIMGTIGLSCECGLDRSWMQGTMVPMRWDDRILTRLAGLLGFDPESPMIKMEMSQILSKGKNARANPDSAPGGTPDGMDLFLGYTEEPILVEELGESIESGMESVSEKSVPELEPALEGSSSAQPATAPQTAPQTVVANRWRFTWLTLGGMVVVVMAGGLFILLRGRS